MRGADCLDCDVGMGGGIPRRNDMGIWLWLKRLVWCICWLF